MPPDASRAGRMGAPAYLEVDSLAMPLPDRILAAAGRVLDKKPPVVPSGMGLRPDQLPVVRSFATYLADLATSPSNGRRSPYCRIVLPPRTGKTVIAGYIIGQTGLTTTFVVPTKTLVAQTAREIERQLLGVPIGLLLRRAQESRRLWYQCYHLRQSPQALAGGQCSCRDQLLGIGLRRRGPPRHDRTPGGGSSP